MQNNLQEQLEWLSSNLFDQKLGLSAGMKKQLNGKGRPKPAQPTNGRAPMIASKEEEPSFTSGKRENDGPSSPPNSFSNSSFPSRFASNTSPTKSDARQNFRVPNVEKKSNFEGKESNFISETASRSSASSASISREQPAAPAKVNGVIDLTEEFQRVKSQFKPQGASAGTFDSEFEDDVLSSMDLDAGVAQECGWPPT
eukprot:TRINITY_DN14350_c0_g1_i1.p1 TRINITY_DN14350_c0_g1~~TRINITY_DN14350_c0_g1_i1.p1  ORF type:complete len:199 (+),score=27.68 TRINITY_DN14350_c0_g1_i1:243-839(+)